MVEKSDIGVFAVKNVDTNMEKLEACKEIITAIKVKYKPITKSMKELGLLDKYKKMNAFVNGGKDWVMDEAIQDLAKIVDYDLEIKKDYNLFKI